MTIQAKVATPAAAQSEKLLSKVAGWIDRRSAWMLPLWIAAYFVVLWEPAHRPLWYDELFTYYVATSPTLERFIGCIRFVDLNPPLSYLFVRLSIATFGDSPFVTRLPSILSFLVASLVVWKMISRRMGGGMGLAALGIMWSFSLTAFAVEARPYALLLAFFSLAVLCWLKAAEASHWTKWHAGLVAAIVAMLLTHCFSPAAVAAIGAGELVRTAVRRRVDKRVWLALFAPMALLPLYIPLVRNAQAMVYPEAFKASAITVPKFYLGIMVPVLPAMGLMLLFWLAGRRESTQQSWSNLAQPHEIAFAIAAFLSPLVTIGYCIWSGVPYWSRYGVSAALGGGLILAALFAFVTKRNSKATVTSAAVILILFCMTRAMTGSLSENYRNTSAIYRTIRPELPFVTASGLTFLEMDHREPPGFANRLFYLTDKDSALRYHATIFEGFPILQKWFPIRAKVEPYEEFIHRNREFLVLATPGYPEDWLLLKLKSDGAEIRLSQDSRTGYRDHLLYEVKVRTQGSPAPDESRSARRSSDESDCPRKVIP